MNPTEMAQVLTLMGTYWPNMKLPADVDAARLMRDSWMRILGDFPSPVVSGVVDWFANEDREFPPSPGQIADRCRYVTDPATRVPGVDEAMTEIRLAIGTHGRSRTPDFSHPAIADAVRSIGWQQICNAGNQDVLRAQIIRVYSTSAERRRRMNALPPSVAGVLEQVAATLELERGE